MNRALPLLTFLGLTVLAQIGLGLSYISVANAVTHNGSVCLSQFSKSCLTGPAIITGQPGSKVRVNVIVHDADSFNEFGVWVRANPSVIRAVSVDLTNSVLQGASTKLQCLGDCNGWRSGGSWAVAEEAIGRPTPAGMTGLLFSIVYQVVGNSTSTTPISLYYTVSPSGWETGGAYLHFTDGCDTSQCWFVPVSGATFNAGQPGAAQPFQTPLAGISRSLPQIAITVGVVGTLAMLLLVIFTRGRTKRNGNPNAFLVA